MAQVNCQKITNPLVNSTNLSLQKLIFNGPKSKTNKNNKSLWFLANFTYHQIKTKLFYDYLQKFHSIAQFNFIKTLK